MFNSRKQPPIKSLIAEGCQIDGHLQFTDGVRVDGTVNGNLVCLEGRGSLVVISESARVVGEVRADHIIISGSVVGPVHSGELLELQPKARIEGDVHYKALEMHQGATVAGYLRPAALVDDKPVLKLAAHNG